MNLQQLGDALGLEIDGDVNHRIDGLASIDRAGDHDLTFVVSAKYLAALKDTQAGAVIVPRDMRNEAPGNVLVSDNPYASYAKASWILHPAIPACSGIDETARIDPSASISSSATIGAYVVIGRDCVVAEHAVIDAHCVLGDRVSIGAGTRLFARVTVCNDVRMGSLGRVQSGAVIGAEGFGYAWAPDGWQQIQQVGGVQIGECVHIGANTTIDCGAIDPTIIGDGVIIDNQVQIAHNVQVGQGTAIAGCVGIAGSTRIGQHCQIGGACNIVGHIRIADGVVLNAASLVTRSIDEKGRYGSGGPLLNERAWRRNIVNLSRLDKLMKRVGLLERNASTQSLPQDSQD